MTRTSTEHTRGGGGGGRGARAVPEGPVSRGGGRGGRRSSECEKGASINCPLPSPLDPPQHTREKKCVINPKH